MIICQCHTVNDLSQVYYDQVVLGLDRSLIQCPDCKQLGFYVNSYYEHSFKLAGSPDKTVILIMQVICKTCGKTHAVLLSSMIPWSQISLQDTLIILKLEPSSPGTENNPLISHEDRVRLRRAFRLFWKERLKAFNISIDDSLSNTCIFHHHRQFMQIHCGYCFSFPAVHIACT